MPKYNLLFDYIYILGSILATRALLILGLIVDILCLLASFVIKLYKGRLNMDVITILSAASSKLILFYQQLYFEFQIHRFGLSC